MANWDQIDTEGDVEDRRGMRTTGVVWGISLTGLLMVLAVWYFWGQDQAINLLNELQSNNQQQTTTVVDHQYDWKDTYETFVRRIVGSSNTLWGNVFKNSGETYTPPKLVLFREATPSGCGWATSEVGPHYCNLDKTIYLDETFFEELTNRFWARGWDVAQGYVIAHEVGHHVQDEMWILKQVNKAMQRNPSSQNELSVLLELQADCYAGIWAWALKNEGIINPSEVGQAIDAAEAVWDDRIQKMTTGRVNPESWTHGSAADRKKWFETGYNTLSVQACDTFKS